MCRQGIGRGQDFTADLRGEILFKTSPPLVQIQNFQTLPSTTNGRFRGVSL
jgi:hypothetical protein